jgi:hypothetical protein
MQIWKLECANYVLSKCCYLYRKKDFCNLSSNPNNSKLGIERLKLGELQSKSLNQMNQGPFSLQLESLGELLSDVAYST